MRLFDTVAVDVLSAAFQTKQLGEGSSPTAWAKTVAWWRPVAGKWPSTGCSTCSATTAPSSWPSSRTASWNHSTRSSRKSPPPTGCSVAACCGRGVPGELIAFCRPARLPRSKPRRPARRGHRAPACTRLRQPAMQRNAP